MKNFVVNVSTKTSKIYLEETSIAVDGENIAGQVIFKFNDEEFIDGIARLEWQNGSDKYFQLMEKVGKTYVLPIKNVMTKEGKMYFQLVITQQAIGEEIPVFKSNQFYVYVEKSINAEGEAPSGYDTWLDYANAKLIEMDNLNIQASKSGNTETITLTDKQGVDHKTYIYDGKDGKDGKDGVDGKDAKINGVNTLNILAGENVTIDQEGSNLTINSSGTSGSGNVDDVLVNGTSVVENKVAKVVVPTKVSDLQNDAGYTTNTGTITSVKMNGTTISSSGEADLGTVITDISGKQDVLTAGDNITIENNVISATASGGDDNDILVLKLDDNSDEAKAKVSKMITANYGKGLLGAISNKDNPALLYNALASKDTSYTFVYSTPNIYWGGSKNKNRYWFRIGGTWNDDIFTCSNITYFYNGNIDNDYRVLTVDNSNSYTPSGDYNPATKKYVDDALANTSVFYAKRTEVFMNATGGGSSNTAIDTDDLTEYNAQCLAAKQFLPIAIKSSAVSNSINFVYMPRIRFNGKLQYMAFAYTSTGLFYMSQSQEISSPVIGSLVRADLTFTTFTLTEKQDKLVSGTNIKTVNNTSLLGSGNIEIQGQTTQVSSLPTAGVSEVGNIYQYIGTTTNDYTNGYFYKCVSKTSVEHIETKNNTTIPINIYADNHKFEYRFKTINFNSNTTWNMLMCSVNEDSSSIWFSSNLDLIFGFDGMRNTYGGYNLNDGQEHTIIYNGDNGDFGIDETVLGQATTYEQNNIQLFDYNSNYCGACVEFYELKVYDKTTGDLVYDFVPANNNGTPALYDSVNQQYYYDSNNQMTYVAGGTTYAWVQCDVQDSNYVKNANWHWTDSYQKVTNKETIADLQWIINYYTKTGKLPSFCVDRYMLNNISLNDSSESSNYKYYSIEFCGLNYVSQSTSISYYIYTHYDTSEMYDDTSNDYYPRTGYKYDQSLADASQFWNYLSKDNENSYTPNGDYNPATKKYVDDFGQKALLQYSTMPDLLSSDAGKISQYKGTTNATYKNGSLYKATPTGAYDNILQINSGSSFALNYQFQDTDNLEIKFTPTMTPSDDGVLGNEEFTSYYMEIHFNGDYMYIGDGYQERNYPIFEKNKTYVINMNNANNEIVINGEVKDSDVLFGSNGTLKLFDYNNNTSFRGNFYYLRIYDKTTGNLKKEWIPATDGSNVVCLQETVGNTYVYNSFDNSQNVIVQAPINDWQLFIDYLEPKVVTNSASTYTISNLTEHYLYNLGEITSLTISAVDTIYLETNIFLESGSTATAVSLPDSVVNIGDAPTMTSSGGVNSGTLDANKKYIIKVLNGIAQWIKY